MTNMKKTFFNKLLLATSSIGLLASMESFAADIVAVPGVGDFNISQISNPNSWRSNNGNFYNPQNNDNIILRRAHRIDLNEDITINTINIYGYSATAKVMEYNNGAQEEIVEGGIVISPNFNNRVVTINNIVNVDNAIYRNAGRDALGEALIYGNKNAKVRIDLRKAGHEAHLIITGNDISGADSIVMGGANAKLTFQNPITVNTKIYSRGVFQGKLYIKNDNIVFESAVGSDGVNNYSIESMLVDDNRSVTLKSNIAAEDISLGKNSTVIIDASKRNIDVRSGIVVNNIVDNQGIVQVKGHAKNTVTFHENIGVQDFRVAEIQIENGKKTEFKQNVYAKKITVASNDVVFEKKLDMAQYNQDNRGNRTNLIHTGNLEFTNRGKVKFNKDYVGTIATSKANIGEVTFVNTPDIYEVGAVNKRIEKLTFTGNHVRNLRKNIYATQVNFDAGTYNVHANPITIDGNAKINGSTFDLRRDLILNGDVEFSGNITFNVTGGYSVFFQNNLYSVAGTNIIISVNGVHPVDAVSALSIFRVNGGAFVPEGHNYNPVTGKMNFRNGLQVQQAGQAAAQEVAQQQARVNSQTQATQAQAQQVQAQVQALAQQQQQKQAQVQAFTQQRDQAQAQVPILAQQRAAERARVQVETEQLRQQLAPFERIINDPHATDLAKQQARAQAAPLQQRQDALQAPADALNRQRMDIQNQARGFEQQRVQAENQGRGLVQQQQQVQADAAAEQQVQDAHAQILAQELVQGQGRAAQAQQQQGNGQGNQQQAQAQQNQQGQGQGEAQQNQQQGQEQQQAQEQAQAQREANERAEQQRLQVERQENARIEQQRLQAEREENARREQQQQEEERRNENERLAQQEANERAAAEENNRRLQVEREANERAEQQRLQAERQANEIRVAEEYVNKPEPQKLAEAINNSIVAHTENAFVSEVQKEVIKEKSALVMKNPEKHAVELAKELVNNQAELKEAVKVANDDTAIKSKTKQEQSLLFVANLANAAQGTPNKGKEIMQRSADQGTRSISVAPVTHEAVTSNINNHLSGGNMIAVAAGDEENPIITKKGLWVAGTFGSSTQDAYKGNPSYKGTVSGGTIGGELYIGENNLVGIAYSRMNSDFKFKGSSIGDKLSAESDIISLYGQQQFGNGFLLQEIFSASNSKIDTKNLRQVGPNSYKTASGKYTSKAYGFEGNIGYQFAAVDGINLMPNIGIRYNTYKDNAYTETGTGVNNMYIAGKSGNLTTGIVGIKLAAPKRLSNDTQIVPGLHASVENSFSNKQPKVKARFTWADNYFENTTSSSTPKVGYNVGASLLTAHKNIELLAAYNCNLRSKYTSHQGSLKLKILF